MNRSLANTVRVRLNVESLESREVPSVTLTSFRSPLTATTAQVRYLSPWIRPSGSTIGGSTTVNIIGILIAL
jgi:hypothetical protein